MSDSFDQARENRAGLRAAMGEVERSLASPATGRVAAWTKTLGQDLDRLAAALENHITASEAPGGMLADIVQAAPRLAHRVERARREHTELRYRLEAAVRALPADNEGDTHAVHEQVVEVLAGIVRHRHLGADLVYEAFNVDIEAAD
ncbi:MAG: hypothetical protein ACYCTI_11995 [Acidimicrobiales bacterium]